MPRKTPTAAPSAPEIKTTPAPEPVAEREPPPAAAAEASVDDPAGPAKQWATSSKSIFSSRAAGIELSEDYRFKQRVLKFNERPDAETLALLKDNGFTYRAAEKAWTVPATAESRAFTDRLARDLAERITGTAAGHER